MTTYLECGSCGALIRVPPGADPVQLTVEHNQNADHTRPGSDAR